MLCSTDQHFFILGGQQPSNSENGKNTPLQRAQQSPTVGSHHSLTFQSRHSAAVIIKRQQNCGKPKNTCRVNRNDSYRALRSPRLTKHTSE